MFVVVQLYVAKVIAIAPQYISLRDKWWKFVRLHIGLSGTRNILIPGVALNERSSATVTHRGRLVVLGKEKL